MPQSSASPGARSLRITGYKLSIMYYTQRLVTPYHGNVYFSFLSRASAFPSWPAAACLHISVPFCFPSSLSILTRLPFPLGRRYDLILATLDHCSQYSGLLVTSWLS
jgi:hypothetical protein